MIRSVQLLLGLGEARLARAAMLWSPGRVAKARVVGCASGAVMAALMLGSASVQAAEPTPRERPGAEGRHAVPLAPAPAEPRIEGLRRAIAVQPAVADGPVDKAAEPRIQGARSTADAEPSPAERRIEEARRAIAAQPERADGYSALAFAYARRARETADPEFYRRADEAVADSLARSPGNLEARKARVWSALGKHEFAAALEEARELNRLVPDDLLVYGYIVDAAAELGLYEEAERAAQWMLDLRAGNVAGLARAAYLRELFGDPEGAVELMEKAYRNTPAAEHEDRAWIAVHLAHLQLAQGKLDAAEQSLDQAFELFPDYHYALAMLANLRTQQRRLDEAVRVRRKHYALAPHPENLYELGVALLQVGQQSAARAAFVEFERRASAESANADNANRELVYYYIDYARSPRPGLAIAEREASRRQDVYTLQALAWALSANKKHAEARRTIDRALGVGIRDAAMLYRAGEIARRGGDRDAAKRWFAQSLEVNPRSELATTAKRALASVAARRATSDRSLEAAVR